MPLTGFNALKERTIEQQIIPNDDTALGNGPIEYHRFADQQVLPFEAQVNYEGRVEYGDAGTILLMEEIQVLILKKYLNNIKPAIRDQVKFESFVFAVQPVILEEGHAWWRVQCLNERLTHKGVKAGGGK